MGAACDRGMELATLRYAGEVRKPAPCFMDIKDEEAETDLLELAEQLIERKAKPGRAEGEPGQGEEEGAPEEEGRRVSEP